MPTRPVLALALAAAASVVAGASAGVAADPAQPRVVTAPTAWLPPEGAVVGTAGIDHRGAGSIDLAYGLGGLAAVELGADSDVRACGSPPCAVGGRDHLADAIGQARAAFRIGARQDAWFRGQPALVLGVRVAIGGAYQVGEAYLVASRELGFARVHAGVAAIDARHDPDARMGTRLRPLAALELSPPQYPKTTLAVDVAWLLRFEPDDPAAMRGRDAPEWVLGWGVRYQALAWGSIELDVRHREDEGLAASTVMVRVIGVLAPAAARR